MVPFAVAPSSDRMEQLPIECIVVGERLRTFSEQMISTLVESMEVNGLVNPITIWRPNGGTEPHLFAGAHRLEAAKRLGWKLIPCLVVAPDDHDRAALMEIDENLARGELSPAERAVHIQKRKPLYERLHPETKHGGAPGKAGGGKEARDPKFGSFADDTAKKAGRSRSSVALDATRAKKIPKIAEVINTSLDKGEELDALAKLPPERQQLVIARAKAGEKVSAKTEAKQARRQEREAELAVKTEAASRELGGKTYAVIYADPPWRFEPYGEGGNGPRGRQPLPDAEGRGDRKVSSSSRG